MTTLNKTLSVRGIPEYKYMYIQYLYYQRKHNNIFITFYLC